MRAIFWIENWDPPAISERAGVQGSIGGLEEHGLFIRPSSSTVAKCLAAHLESVDKVLIAYHPATMQEKATLRADMLLPEVAEARKEEVIHEFAQRPSEKAFSSASEQLSQGKVAVVAKCLRQEPSTRPLGSHLFDRLVDISQARNSESELKRALQALEKEFAMDRGALLL